MIGLIVEGVTAAGKSTLLNGLQTRMVIEVPAATKVFVSEHYTERLFEDKVKQDGAVAVDIIDHACSLCSQIEYLHGIQQNGKFYGRGGNSEIFVFLERFLGSHFANLRIYAGNTDLNDFVEKSRMVYQRMMAFGFRIAIIVPTTDYLKRALADTRERRNDAWVAFLDRLGESKDLINHFVAWQNELLRFYEYIALDTDVQYFQIDKRDQLLHIVDEILDRVVSPTIKDTKI